MLFIDTHADTPQRFVDEHWDFVHGPLGAGMIDLASARAGGLHAEFFAIWVQPDQWQGRFAHRTLALIDGVLEQVRKHPAELALCLSAKDIRAAQASNRFAVLLGLEGGHSIENSLALLRLYHRLGVRYMTLTWSNTNEWADSCGDLDSPDVLHHGGLTPFGHQVVHEMNRLGMIVDISHASDDTFWQVLETSRAPILATHSSARALTDVPRNLTDEMLRALAAKKGAAMINFYPAFIDETWRDAWEAQRPERQQAHDRAAEPYVKTGKPVPFFIAEAIDKEFASRFPRAPFKSLIDHIDHIAQVAGIDHVGIGTDFDGIPSLPEGLESAADLPKIATALTQRGYSASDLEKIFGGNLLRVFAEVQAATETT